MNLNDLNDLTRRQRLRAVLDAVPQAGTVNPEPPLAWFQMGLSRWFTQRCMLRERVYAQARCLHRDYLRWCEGSTGEIPCGLPLFLEWFHEQGYVVRTSGLMYGIIHKRDWESVYHYGAK